MYILFARAAGDDCLLFDSRCSVSNVDQVAVRASLVIRVKYLLVYGLGSAAVRTP